MAVDRPTRRTIVRGAAWATPVVAMASAAPAMAVSSCNTGVVDEAFAANPYRCNGARPKLEINFYQSVSSPNGWGATTYVNVKNLSSCAINFTAANPLRLRVRVRSNETNNRRRPSLGFGTSWGTLTATDRATNTTRTGGAITTFGDSDMNVVSGTELYNIDWTFTGNLPGTSGGDNEADLRLQWSSGPHVYYEVTPLATSGAPTLESITTDATQQAACAGYYQTKLDEYVAQNKNPIDWVYKRFNANNNSNTTEVPLAVGTSVSSKVARNGSTGLAGYDFDGIW